MVQELDLKWSPAAFRDYALPMREDGTILFQPYALAEIGVKLAGKPRIMVDKLGPEDFMELAQKVMSFFGTGPTTGSGL